MLLMLSNQMWALPQLPGQALEQEADVLQEPGIVQDKNINKSNTKKSIISNCLSAKEKVR